MDEYGVYSKSFGVNLISMICFLPFLASVIIVGIGVSQTDFNALPLVNIIVDTILAVFLLAGTGYFSMETYNIFYAFKEKLDSSDPDDIMNS